MALTAKLSPLDPKIKFGESVEITVTAEGADAAASLTYAWKVDGVAAGTASKLSVSGDKIGTKAITVDVTSTLTDEESGSDPVVETASAATSVVVEKLTFTGITAAVTASESEIKAGEEVTFTCTVTGAPSDATITYKWSTGETTSSITVTPTEVGSYVGKCDVVVKKANYNDFKVNRSKSVTVLENVIETEEGVYIWQLPHIDAAFMYGSWWALDEIDSLTEAGKDWKTETDLKYPEEIKAFRIILKNYNHIMIQESRNGRIIDKQKLDSGRIY